MKNSNDWTGRLTFALLTLLAALIPGMAWAAPQHAVTNPLSYNSLRVSYIAQKSDYFDDIAHGYGLQGSWLVGKNVYLMAGATQLRFHALPGHLRSVNAGIGFQENPMGNTSGFLQVMLYHTRAETSSVLFGDHTDGWARFSWGFRTLTGKTSPWEIDGAVYYDSHEKFGGRSFGIWAGVGAAWDHVSLHLRANHNGAQNTVRFSLGVYF